MLQVAPALLLGQRAGDAAPRDPEQKLRVERPDVHERHRLIPVEPKGWLKGVVTSLVERRNRQQAPVTPIIARGWGYRGELRPA